VTDRLKKKLRSSKGASITFALLLFLVCAVIGSVVLAAGTASAGRFSKLAESDARYYSVTSAVNLLRDSFDGASVKHTEKFKTDFQEIIEYNTTYPDGHDISPDLSGYDRDSVESEDPDDPNPKFEGDNEILIDALKEYINHPASESEVEYNFVHNFPSGVSAEDSNLKVNIKIKQNTNCDLEVTVSSDDTAGEVFTVVMTFEAKITTSVSSTTIENSKIVSGNPNNLPYTEIVDKTKIDTEITSIVWSLTDIRRTA